ncbi:MAG: N-6 DNA methylase, partial [Desulfoplanes sp.]
NLIRKGYIKGIIGLPANLFYGTGIPACIVIVDKKEAHSRKGIFMIDAGKAFLKDGNKNRLRARDIHKIVDVFTHRIERSKYSRMVGFEEIEKNDFNLNLPRYIDSQEPEDMQNIDAHLHGGVPGADVDRLEAYWKICPNLRQALFVENRPGYLDLTVDQTAIKTTIFEHPEFIAFTADLHAHFSAWKQQSADTLRTLEPGFQPKERIFDLSEDLLAHYTGKSLINRYDVYQHLMDYWAETMQDDCYLIAADGWKAETYRVIVQDKKGKEKDKGWDCDLIPKPLIVARYFAKDQETIDDLSAELESLTAQRTELEEEHGGEDGAFSELDKINKANITARYKTIKRDKEAREEAAVLKQWLDLNKKEADLKKTIKMAEAKLDDAAYAQYPKLSEEEIKTLVVEDKWLASLETAVNGELDRISQGLTKRVKELAERYAKPLPVLSERVAELEEKVGRHLAKMGFSL